MFLRQERYQVLVWDLQTPVLSHGKSNWCFARVADHTGRLSLPGWSPSGAPLFPPGAPGWTGVRAGEAAACARALSGSTWHPAELSSSAPLHCTCMRCTGAEGNRFPSVSCAAAELCASPTQRPVLALPCAAAALCCSHFGSSSHWGRAQGAPAPDCGPGRPPRGRLVASCPQGRLSTPGKSLTASWETPGSHCLCGCQGFLEIQEGVGISRKRPHHQPLPALLWYVLQEGMGDQSPWHSALVPGGRGRPGAGTHRPTSHVSFVSLPSAQLAVTVD